MLVLLENVSKLLLVQRPLILLLQVAHEAKELAQVVMYPSLAAAVVAPALERASNVKGAHGV